MIRSTLVAACCAAVLLPAQESADAPVVHGHSRQVDDVDLIFLRGDDRQRGFAEGYLRAERIRTLFEDFALHEDIVRAPAMWNILVLPRVRQRVDIPDWVRARCEGMLEGMKAKDPELLHLTKLRRDLTVDDMVAATVLPDLMGIACSSFVAWGDAVEGEGPVVGRNLDYMSTPKMLESTEIIVHAPAEGRAGFVSIGWAGVVGVLTAISEHGVSVAVHDVFGRAVKGEKVTPRVVALQELTTRFTPGRAPMAEAAALLRQHRFGMGANIMVGWRGRDDVCGPGGAVYELWPHEEKDAGVTVRGPADGQPFVVCTNHHRARIDASNCWRFDRLAAGLGQAEGAFDFQESAGLIRKPQVSTTLYQNVVNLETGELSVRMRRAPGQDVWDEIEGLDYRELIREAATGKPVERR